MVDRNIANKLGLSQEKLQEQVEELFGEGEGQYLEQILQKKVDSRLPGSILKGTIVSRWMPTSSAALRTWRRARRSRSCWKTRIPKAV